MTRLGARGGLVGACALAAAMAIVLPASVVQAHAVMIDPPPRDPDQIKIAPCGGAGPTPAGGAQRTVLQAGSTITVEFHETIQHPGYFRIAFSPDGLSGFDQHILVPMIADTDGLKYTAQVHLPSTSCDNCSLQLIQCMDGSLPPIASCNNYYSCSDIVLTGGTPPGPSADAGPGAADAGGGPGEPGGADSGPSDDPGVGPAPGFGCGVSGRRSSAPWAPLAVFGLVVLAGCRRRWRACGAR